MKSFTIYDDIYAETTEEDIERMYEFMLTCPDFPELNDVLTVTFTKEEWDAIFGEYIK